MRKQSAINKRGHSLNTQEFSKAESKRKYSSNQTRSCEGRLENFLEGLAYHKRSGFFFNATSSSSSFFGRALVLGGLFGRGGSIFGESLGLNSARGPDSSNSVVMNEEEGEEKAQSSDEEIGGELVVFQSDSKEISNPREEQEGDSWEESCLKKFSTTMGLPTIGHEKDILNLMIEE